LARIVAFSPCAILLILTIGVLPIDSELSSKNGAIGFSFHGYITGILENWNNGMLIKDQHQNPHHLSHHSIFLLFLFFHYSIISIIPIFQPLVIPSAV